MLKKRMLINVVLLILGTAIMAIGINCFLLPNKLSTGGMSGIATLIYYIFNIPVGITSLILNVPLFIIALIRNGKKTLLKSVLGTVLLSTFLELFKVKALTQDSLLASIYGGILVGFGSSLNLKADASTGGTELVAMIIRSFNKHIRNSNIIVILDSFIIAINVIFLKDFEIALYSAIAIYIMGKLIDIIFEGIYFTKMIFIVSEKHEEIAEKIGTSIKRGTTGIYSKGMYTKKDMMMLLCISSRNEAIKIKQIAEKIDKEAFIVIANAREAFGQGFKD